MTGAAPTAREEETAGLPAGQLAVLWPPEEQVRAGLLHRCPPRPVPSSWPATEQPREQITGLLARHLAGPPDRSAQQKRRQLTVVLDWLQAHDGVTWQQRWLASGAETDPRGWARAAARQAGRASQRAGDGPGAGLGMLICADVIRPGISWLLASPGLRGLAGQMGRIRDRDGMAALTAMCDRLKVGLNARRIALRRIAVVMAAKGGAAAEITAGDCIEVHEAATAMMTSEAEHSAIFYQLLHGCGFIPGGAPLVRRPRDAYQKSAEELVDRFGLACRPVRDLLVAYLKERQPALDYTTLENLSRKLALHFWRDLEEHHPGIASLRLDPAVAAAWRQRVQLKTTRARGPDGTVTVTRSPRLEAAHVLGTVRAFYLDINEWAIDDPARWGPWAASPPVRAEHVGAERHRRQRKARMDQRTRERMPVLPILSAHVTRERDAATERLKACLAAAPGQEFTTGGQTLRRCAVKAKHATQPWAQDPAGGRRRDLAWEEHRAFWTWAAVEVLRLTGIRIEELAELSHHSLIQYRLPATGELIPLLQIAPSKTDEERLLVIGPELADVLATIVARVRDPSGAIPLVSGYDRHEKVRNPPMPLLFQWRSGLGAKPVAETTIRHYLAQALSPAGITSPSGEPLYFTPHDFRRLFITDAIMHGMPPHIAQLVAGHKDINTTMGYNAVYPQEVINGHRAFITRRRSLRPAEEYRTPTDEEWEEFTAHFERRRVELGDCGRAYSTPCVHEHSCLRCPLLRPDPTQRHRLTQIRASLLARIAEAEANHWLGEAEGLNVSLAGAEQKLAQMDQITAQRSRAVQLGMPSFPQAAGRTIIPAPSTSETSHAPASPAS